MTQNKETVAVLAFLSAMKDSGLDGARVRDAMLSAMGVSAAEQQAFDKMREALEEANSQSELYKGHYGQWADVLSAAKAVNHPEQQRDVAQPSEDLLQDVAAYIGVGGYNGAIPQQLADRIRAEFDRLHQPVIPSQDEIEKLAHRRCKRYVHLDDTPYRFNGHTLMHFVMGITDILTRKETNEQ